MDGKRLYNLPKINKVSSLEQVTTHFGALKTERVPMVISLEDLPSAEEYKNVVDGFYENLKSSHPYQYQDIIGEGGMGVVEMVKDKKCLRSIAKKTLNASKYDKESIIRFTEEAQITAQLEHPNIVPVYEMGMDDKKQLYYTMKMVKGRNLKEILKLLKDGDEETINKFPLARLLEIFTAVCDAMSYACSRKIVHRDLKPDNIMVGDYGEVYIVDWGLAKIVTNDATASTENIPEWIVHEVYNKKDSRNEQFLKELRKIDSLRTKDKDINISFNDILIGTPQYMAPERISGEADECSEVYALGAILYNILTLELTVKGENLEEIVTKIFNEEIKSPLKFNNLTHLPDKKVPPSLAAVTMKALSAEPVDRYHKVAHLRNEISAWEDGYITEAEKAGPWLVLWTNIKRHKIESAIALTFSIIFIFTYVVYAFSLQKDLKIAENSETVALTQKAIVDRETVNFKKQSKELQYKITELENLAPVLYERSKYYLKINEPDKALETIINAIKIKALPSYFVLCGNIQQTQKMFSESISSYNTALNAEGNSKGIIKDLEQNVIPNSEKINDSIELSLKLQNKTEISYVDLLNLKEFLISQKRLHEAGHVSRELSRLSEAQRGKALTQLKRSGNKEIKGKHISISSDGGLILNIQDLNIDDISALAGIPFKSINLNNTDISDLRILKGMPLEFLDISSTAVSDIKFLRGAPLKSFKARNTPIKSLDGLNNSPLEIVDISNTQIKSLAGLKTLYIKNLNLAHTNIKSLKGLNFKSLRNLDISNTAIENLSPLRHSQLMNLNINNTAVKELTSIERLFITVLDISNCQIVSFKPLIKLPLERFTADNSNINDLTFLSEKRLNHFSARNTDISSLESLKNMPIKFLNITGTKIKSLKPLSNFPLENLILDNCKIKHLPPLNNISDMARISLKNTLIENIPSLGNKHYEMLDFSQTKIKSIKNLSKITVQNLYLSHTEITDLSPLKGKSFTELKINDTPIYNLSPLSESLIEMIDISSIPATDFQYLSKANLEKVLARNSKLTSPSFINKQTIKVLELNSSQVNDLSPLEGSNIEIINLAHTPILDLSPLKSCNKLLSLDLYQTKIKKLNDLSNLKLKTLVIGECEKIRSIQPLKKIRTLSKLIFPSHVKNIEFLRGFKFLKILGTDSSHHGQSTDAFWKKHEKRQLNEQ